MKVSNIDLIEKSRLENSRRLEQRCAELEHVMEMKYKSPLHFDEDEIPEGWEYYWVRESLLGEPDNSRAPEVKMKGWSPVPADRHPKRIFNDFLNRNEHLKGYISHKGSILFERPKKFGELERKASADLNWNRINSMPGLHNFMSEPSIPGRFIGDQRPLIERSTQRL